MRCETCDYEDRLNYNPENGRVRQRGEIAGAFCQKCFREIYSALTDYELEVENEEGVNPRPVPDMSEY